jgi:hypothetical protein
VTTAAKASPKPKPKKVSASEVARQAEVVDDVVIVEQCGVKLRIPIAGKTPIAALDAYLVGDEYRGNKALLGAEQWQALIDAGATMDDLDEIGNKIKEAAGN